MFILVIAILSIESSYAKNVERPAGKVPDTVQFCFAPDAQWRIRTYAIDQDIHIHDLPSKRLDSGWAVSHVERQYGDVLARTVVLELRDPRDSAEVERELAKHKLTGKLEVTKEGFVFYTLDAATYRTKSTPR